MLHACLYTISFVFCYTSWHFYAFSGTNLFTRCHSVSSLFLLFLCFRKATREIFSELDKTKAEVPHFLTRRRSPKMRWRGARGSAHPRVARQPLARATKGWAALAHLLTLPLCLYNPLDGKNLGDRSLFHETYCKPLPSPSRDWEDPGALPGTLPEAFYTTMVAFGVMCE
jgi:hypothetical protein